ncbi:MAG: muramoyltetrapeptide carboxypeptidase LdcA involved in peptidoglycan recycling [Limisphaerales bacterium]|jgi:muramoyltetrapeptide carboxypeptidase LdcA involved in peptidoglycan recycling
MSLNLVKPTKLKAGGTAMTVSLSWGAAGSIPWRFKTGVKQFEESFGLKVVPAANSNKPADWIYRNPKARAEDLMQAFSDPEVSLIICNIGGEDSIRILPYIDLDIIRNNPKVFVGFSDSTISHLANLKAGLVSFYGPSLFAGFAENGGIFSYLSESFKQVCFSAEPAGIISPNLNGWTNERLDWFDESLGNIKRTLNPPISWRFLQDKGIVTGHLIGGCIEVLEFIKGTQWFPEDEIWEGAILFFETSEEKMAPDYFRWMIRNYAASGVLKKINGLLIGRPYDNVYAAEYEENLIKVIRDEEGLDFPIVTQMDFGHSEPMMTLPIGVMAEINSENKTIRILESAVS